MRARAARQPRLRRRLQPRHRRPDRRRLRLRRAASTTTPSPSRAGCAPLVAALEADPGLGAASSKILFADRYWGMRIDAPGHRRARRARLGRGGRRRAGVGRRPSSTRGSGVPSQPLPGEPGARWTHRRAEVRVVGRRRPAQAHRRPAVGRVAHGRVTLDDRRRDRAASRSGAEPPGSRSICPAEPHDVINNVGSNLYAGGFGGDRGYLERDEGQYDEPVDVFAWCGGSVLLRRPYLRQVGLFDERFFLYYEDTDLSWRGRLLGWRYRVRADVGRAPRARRHAAARAPTCSATSSSATGCSCWPRTRRRAWRVRAALIEARSTARAVTAEYLRPMARGQRPRPEHRAAEGALDAQLREAPAGDGGRPARGCERASSRSATPSILRVDGDEVRIAVYDQYWSTLGGGEQFAGGIAAALADHHDVTLVGPEPIDTARFAERLGIDLAGLPLRRIDQESDVSVLSADYDLLVNCTYQSTAVNRAAHGIYVVHFPGEVAGAAAAPQGRGAPAPGPAVPADDRAAQRLLPARPAGRRPAHRRRRRGRRLRAGRHAGRRSRCGPSRPPTSSCGTGARRLAAADLDAGQTADLPFVASGAWPQQVVVAERHLSPRGPARRDLALRRHARGGDARRPPPPRAARPAPHEAAAARPPRPPRQLRHDRLELAVHGARGSSGCGAGRARCSTRRCAWSTPAAGPRSRSS